MALPPSTYTIVMVVHNGRAITQLSTLRTLRHSAKQDARLVVVDNGSSDGAEQSLKILAQRGDIDLIRNERDIGHGPAIELARRSTRSPYLVTLANDAFPLCDDWLTRLRSQLNESTRVTGIRHHRDYIHPSCLMIERETLEKFDLSFLEESASGHDVGERISVQLQQRGYKIAGIPPRRSHQERGSASEPLLLGSDYDGIVYHQWVTTRDVTSDGREVDEVPTEALERALQTLIDEYHAESRELVVVVGVRVPDHESERLRNLRSCLHALSMQDLPRWHYRIVVVEQDVRPKALNMVAPFMDLGRFAYNPGPFNRSWGFNVGASLAGSRQSVLCFMDADLLVPRDFLRRGLNAMREGRRAMLPYAEVLYLDAEATRHAIRDSRSNLLLDPTEQHYRGRLFTNALGGCILVDASHYHEIGGHDERFRGWGYEDREFYNRLASTTPVGRLPMRLLHLDHPRQATHDTRANANLRIYRRRDSEVAIPKAIGDPNLYIAERPRDRSVVPRLLTEKRDWERWHTWSDARLKRIVDEELNCPKRISSRYSLAKRLVQLGDSLLDVGCGPGALWTRLGQYRPEFSWTGIDATYEMVNMARRLFPDVPVFHGDAASLPFASASFDIVLLRHVLEHLPLWLMELALAESMRVARKCVVLDFYRVPTESPRQTSRVGNGFLETRWGRADIEGPIRREKWFVDNRFVIKSGNDHSDEIWEIRPPAVLQNGNTLPAMGPLADPKVSIIMPTYRRQHAIFRTIRTIQAQTYENWELIVIDNAGDGGYSFCDPRIRLYCHTAKPSASYARNQGLAYATGNLVCFFDDDDDMFPCYLERFVKAFQDNPHANLVRCGMIARDGRINYSYATSECCLRRQFATPTWRANCRRHDQEYFQAIISQNRWFEEWGDIVVVREPLYRGNQNRTGGLRSGDY